MKTLPDKHNWRYFVAERLGLHLIPKEALIIIYLIIRLEKEGERHRKRKKSFRFTLQIAALASTES